MTPSAEAPAIRAPLVEDPASWLRSERALLSKHAKVAKAIDYLLSSDHRPSFKRFLQDGRVCLTNNCAERSLRGVALGRRSWLFAGSERGGHRAAFMYSLIGSAKLNGVDPRASLPELFPWNRQRLAGSAGKSSLMARPTYAYSMDHVASMIDESPELIAEPIPSRTPSRPPTGYPSIL